MKTESENKKLEVNWLCGTFNYQEINVVVLKRTVLIEISGESDLWFLFGFLGQQHCLNIWQDTTLSNGDSGQ